MCAQAQTKSLAQALSSAQQAMQDARQGTNGVPTQARQGADRVPTEGSQQGATMTSSPARQAAAPKLARQVMQLCKYSDGHLYVVPQLEVLTRGAPDCMCLFC